MSDFRYRESDLRALYALARYVEWNRHDKDISKLTPAKSLRAHWVKRRWARLTKERGYVLTRLGERELNAFRASVKK